MAPGCAGVSPCRIPESQVDGARFAADEAERALAPVVAQRDSVQRFISILEARRDSLASLSPDLGTEENPDGR
jgi:hypothetical protein